MSKYKFNYLYYFICMINEINFRGILLALNYETWEYKINIIIHELNIDFVP